MTLRTPQCEVFCPLLSSSEHSGVPEDSQPLTFPSVGLHPHTWPKWGCDKTSPFIPPYAPSSASLKLFSIFSTSPFYAKPFPPKSRLCPMYPFIPFHARFSILSASPPLCPPFRFRPPYPFMPRYARLSAFALLILLCLVMPAFPLSPSLSFYASLCPMSSLFLTHAQLSPVSYPYAKLICFSPTLCPSFSLFLSLCKTSL